MEDLDILKQLYYDKDKQREYTKTHRTDKQKLYLNGELIK